MSFNAPPPRRNLNRDSAKVRSVLSHVHRRLSAWHEQTALVGAMITHRSTEADRRAALDKIGKLRSDVAGERGDLIRAFMDQPPELAGHSRVVDTEKSIDGLEAALDSIESGLR